VYSALQERLTPLFGPFSFLGITQILVEISCFSLPTFVPNIIPFKHTKFSISKTPNSIFGEFFQFFFMIVDENSQKNIGDKFFKFDCGDM